MVGQNFRPKQLSPDESQKPVLRVELSEDEASGEDFLSVTYPGRRRRAGAANQAAAGASDRKVRFDGDRKPLKSALKKSSSSSSSDTTLVDTSDEESATFTDSSDIDTSEDDAPVRRRRGKSKKSKEGPCKKTKSEDSSAAKDALPHPTCTCDECVKGRKILKAVIKFEAKTKAAEETGEIQSHGKNKGQQQGRKNRSNEASDTEGDTTDADTTGDEKKPSPKGKKNKKQKQTQKASPKERTCPSPAGEPRAKAVNKSLFKLPEYPKEMKPTLIMRPEARVMQIEHALETPYDPRPNAFYDNGKGITRVYHGPRYGNPNGKLYADYDSGKVTTPRTPAGFPVGVIHNPYNPWLAPGAPGAPGPVPYLGPNPAMFAQMADSEEAMKKAADQGFGLSGLPPPSVPPYFKEMQKEAAQQVDWQKSGSGKGSKKLNSGWSPPKGGNTWQKTGSDRGSKKEDAVWGATPGWGNEDKSSSKSMLPLADTCTPAYPSQDKNESGGWGGGGGADATWGAVDSGSKKGSNKDGCASPHNFGGWGDTNQPETTFQRSRFCCVMHDRRNWLTFSTASKDGGSQKHGSQKNWNGEYRFQFVPCFQISCSKITVNSKSRILPANLQVNTALKSLLMNYKMEATTIGVRMTIRTVVDGEAKTQRSRLGAQWDTATVSRNCLLMHLKRLPTPNPHPLLMAPQETMEAVIGLIMATTTEAGAMEVPKPLLPLKGIGAILETPLQAGV